MKRLTLLLFLLMGCCGRIALDAQRNLAPPECPLPMEPTLVRSLLHDERCRQWVDSVMETLTLEERIGQLFIYTIAPQQDAPNKALLRRVVKDYGVGGLLFSGGRWEDQAALTNEAQRLADVPLLMTFDGEWGLSMRLKDMPTFPRNMVLGCIASDSLLYEYGKEMARQCKEMGVQVNFAPVADVNINPRNPVINNRSFGENPENVARKTIAYAAGLEAGGVLSVSKHFPGHGDTGTDSHKTLPVLPFSRERLDSIELLPFRKAIRAGLGGIMVGHLEVPALEARHGLPASLSHNVVTTLLKEELGFRGLAFTDALAMKGAGTSNTLCLQALEAGHDLLLVPYNIKTEQTAVLDAVKKGQLSADTIAAKCRKVLTYKYALGLTSKPFVQRSGLENRIRTPHTEQLISQLNLAAITVAGDKAEEMLPIDPTVKDVAVLTIGDESMFQPFVEQLSHYAHPTTLRLQAGLSVAAQKRLQEKLAKFSRVLVCVGERKLGAYRSFLDGLKMKVPPVYLFFVPEKHVATLQRPVQTAGTMVLAHSTRDDVQRQTAKLLYGEAGADGRLSVSIGTLFAAGDGVTISPHETPFVRPEDHGMDSKVLARIDTLILSGIQQGAFPGCQVVVLKDGEAVYDKTFGTHTWPTDSETSPAQPVRPTDVYDIASLTKAVGTVLAVMKLYDQGRINLTDQVGDFLPFFRGTNKADISVRQLLMHESGLPSTLLFYLAAIDKDSYPGTLLRSRKSPQHTIRIGGQTWANPKFRFLKGMAAADSSEVHTLHMADGLWLHRSFKDSIMQKIADTPLRDKRYRYSCVGFVLLQQIVEARAGMPLDAFLEKEFYGPMGLKRTGYLPLRRIPKEEIVPSSNDPFLRRNVLQGYVHDETAAFLGGVSGNAGLFSTAEEVAALCQMLLDDGVWKGERYLSESTCHLFTTVTSRRSRRGLGFDKPDTLRPDKSPCAESAPASVYGHTGFTGTCAWIDPDNHMVFVFICNRIYPNSWNTKLTRLNIRPRIQELLYEAMMK